MRRFATMLLIVTVLLLGACGFHLRGTAVLPRGMHVVYVQDTQPVSVIGNPLRESLSGSGARVTASADEAGASVRIVRESFDRRLVSTNSKSGGGIVRDYELSYSVTFSAQSKEANWTQDEQTLTVAREYSFDESQMLAKTAEQEQLQRDMVQDAVRQMLLRLQAQAK